MLRISLAMLAAATVAAAAHAAQFIAPQTVLADSLAAYASLDRYADTATSRLELTYEDGATISNTMVSAFSFERDVAATLEDFIGLSFFIDEQDRKVVTYSPGGGRYASRDFGDGTALESRFGFLGMFVASGHPIAAVLTTDSDEFPAPLRHLNVERVGGEFHVTGQADAMVLGARGWTPVTIAIDSSNGAIRRIDYDVGELFRTQFDPRIAAGRASVTFSPKPAPEPVAGFSPRPEDVAVDNLVSAPAAFPDDDGTPQALLNRPAPPFVVHDHQARALASHELRGKPSVLYFWATWCPNCLMTRAAVEAAAARYGDDVNVVLINIDDPSGTRALEQIERNGWSAKTHFDASNAASRAYRVIGTPTIYVLDSETVVRDVIIGGVGDLQDRLEESLSDRAAAEPG